MMSSRNTFRRLLLAALLATAACSAAPSATEGESEDELRGTAGATAATVAEKDLALVFDRAAGPGQLLAATTAASRRGQSLLLSSWYDTVLNAYKQTSVVKTAVADEDTFDDWRNVSARIEPCAPLGVSPFQQADSLCWPQIRLVWQPIKANVSFRSDLGATFTVTDFPDDRAIHALYDLDPALALQASEAVDVRELIARVRTAATAGTWSPSSAGPLTAAEVARFTSLRDAAARALLLDAVALRDPSIARTAYTGVGPRPELAAASTRTAFLKRWLSFVSKYTVSTQLTQLTTFSLKSGRFPDNLWQGNFLSFRPSGGQIEQTAEPIYSSASGALLLRLAKEETVQVLAGPAVEATDLSALKNNPIGLKTLLADSLLNRPDTQSPPAPGSPEYLAVVSRARDRTKVGLANTACMTCHQLDVAENPRNPLDPVNLSKVNFHNLSSFVVPNRLQSKVTDVGVKTSSRVIAEVAFDLDWLRKRALP